MSYYIKAIVRGQMIKIKKVGLPDVYQSELIHCYALLDFLAQYNHVAVKDVTKITYYKGDKILYDFDYIDGIKI